MAFPTTGILDNFNTGANENLTARSGWDATGGPYLVWSGTWTTDAAPTYAQAHSSDDNAWGTAATDTEVYAVAGSTGLNNQVDTFSLFARLNVISFAPNGYYLNLLGGWDMGVVVAGTFTSLGSAGVQAVASGASVGLEVIGSQVSAYYKASGGSWVQRITASDSTFTGSGLFGMSTNGTYRMDAFGGGQIGTNWTFAGISNDSSTGLVSPVDIYHPTFTPVEFAPRRISIRRS